MKVLHLPTSTGGNAWGLAQGEKLMGLESTVLIASKSHFNYPYDHCLDLDDLDSSYFAKCSKLISLLKAFCKIRNQYDIFHFNFGSSLIHFPSMPFLNQFDLPLYPRKAGLFATYNGCDARQKYPTMSRCKTAACHEKECYKGMCNSGKLDVLRRKGIEKMSRYVQHIWAVNPDLLHFLPKEKSSFLPYTVWCSPNKPAPILQTRCLKIAHIPTNAVAKGTKYIFNALKNLEKKYPNAFEVLTLDKYVSSQEVLKLYVQADLVIDQILIGWYGASAVECMLLGKPVIARIAQEELTFIPSGMAKDLQEAIIHADPLTIESVLERCLTDRQFLQSQAVSGREYAMRWHDPKYVASLTKAQYEAARK
jgi:hypothetical protein